MLPRPVLIVKTGTTVPSVAERRGDFEAWIAKGLGLAQDEAVVARVYLGEALPPLREVAAVVVTGSAAMVTDRAAWSERTARFLSDAVQHDTPVLGICYGHQLLAHACGGTVEDNPRGRNIGTVDVELSDHAFDYPWLSALGRTLHVPVSHLQSVTALPRGARRLASTARDPNHAFALGDRAFGVQFHPEFDADIVRGYIDARRTQLAIEGRDADQIWQDARDTSHGTELLQHFAKHHIRL